MFLKDVAWDKLRVGDVVVGILKIPGKIAELQTPNLEVKENTIIIQLDSGVSSILLHRNGDKVEYIGQ